MRLVFEECYHLYLNPRQYLTHSFEFRRYASAAVKSSEYRPVNSSNSSSQVKSQTVRYKGVFNSAYSTFGHEEAAKRTSPDHETVSPPTLTHELIQF